VLLESTESLTKTSTRDLTGSEGRPVRKIIFTDVSESTVYKNVGASSSHKLIGMHGLLYGQFIIHIPIYILHMYTYYMCMCVYACACVFLELQLQRNLSCSVAYSWATDKERR
jgi:hypothetical protein